MSNFFKKISSFFKSKKNLLIIFISFFFVISASSISFYFFYWKPSGEISSNNNKDNKKQLDPNKLDDKSELINNISNYSEDEIFPEINERYYYDYIEIESGKGILNEKFVTFFVKDIIRRRGVQFGDIKFDYKIFDDQNLKVEFVWIYEDEKVYKNYYFHIEHSV
ncbi:MHO_1590 family protein [[Mycoplasma] collis]|uniref:MHO_1590 family protein n=1 Tax=[Mycoplasma] collis TaxID=2127 RepID=UPI000AA0DE1A|nr:hypothetical protein [[Mycoplasma] collis]